MRKKILVIKKIFINREQLEEAFPYQLKCKRILYSDYSENDEILTIEIMEEKEV